MGVIIDNLKFGKVFLRNHGIIAHCSDVASHNNVYTAAEAVNYYYTSYDVIIIYNIIRLNLIIDFVVRLTSAA